MAVAVADELVLQMLRRGAIEARARTCDRSWRGDGDAADGDSNGVAWDGVACAGVRDAWGQSWCYGGERALVPAATEFLPNAADGGRAMVGELWRHGSEGSVAATKGAGSAFESPARGVSAAEAVGVQVPIATLR